MSRSRLFDLLPCVFESRDLLPALLGHQDFISFLEKHSLSVSLKDLVLAFTHKSFSHEFNVPHMEQLEFLGDAVLQLIISEELFERFPLEKEGQLSKMRSAVVNESRLAELARGLELQNLIIVGKGEFKKGLYLQDTVLADSLEALLAVVYRAHGLNFTKRLLVTWLEAHMPEALSGDFLSDFDAKSKLQEKVLARFKKLPRYTSEAAGEKFEVSLWINDELCAKGIFPSKKSGEKELATDYLKKGIL